MYLKKSKSETVFEFTGTKVPHSGGEWNEDVDFCEIWSTKAYTLSTFAPILLNSSLLKPLLKYSRAFCLKLSSIWGELLFWEKFPVFLFAASNKSFLLLIFGFVVSFGLTYILLSITKSSWNKLFPPILQIEKMRRFWVVVWIMLLEPVPTWNHTWLTETQSQVRQVSLPNPVWGSWDLRREFIFSVSLGYPQLKSPWPCAITFGFLSFMMIKQYWWKITS